MEPINGTLTEMSLVNVLQKLQSQRATGALTLNNRIQDHEVRVWLASGQILHVNTNCRSDYMRLGSLLVRGQLLAEETMAYALHRSQQQKQLLGVMLVKDKELQEKAVTAMLHIQFKDDLFTASRWRTGSFSFEPQAVPSPWRSTLPIKTRELSAQLATVRGHWGEIKRLVPSRNSTFRKMLEGEIPSDQAQTHKLSKTDRYVFNLIHPSRTFDELMALGRVSCLHLYMSLFKLNGAGFIRLSGNIQRNPNPDQNMATVTVIREESPRTTGDSVIFHVATTVLIVMAAALGLLFFLNTPDRASTAADEDGAVTVRTTQPVGRLPLAQAQMEKLNNAIRIYQLRQGELPTRLEALVNKELLREGDLTYPDYDNTYVYRPDGDDFIVVRPKR